MTWGSILGSFSGSVSIMMGLLVLAKLCPGSKNGTMWMDMDELAGLKKGAVDNEGDFIYMANGHFTDYCKPLGIWVNRLRKVIFPKWRKTEKGKIGGCFLERSALSGEMRQHP